MIKENLILPCAETRVRESWIEISQLLMFIDCLHCEKGVTQIMSLYFNKTKGGR